MARVLSMLLALALAGCMTPSGDETPDDTNATMPTPGIFAPPPPIDDSQQVSGSADPANFATGGICGTPTAQCVRYPFTTNGTVMIMADLTWTLPASDFDFYVVDGEGAQAISGASPPQSAGSTSEHLEGELPAGDYEIVVVPWSVALDTYTLHAEFMVAEGNMTHEENTTSVA